MTTQANNSAESDGIIYLRDFSKLDPQDTISVEPIEGKWQLRPLNDEMVLYSDGSAEVEEVTYPIDLNGWYDIYIGLVEKPQTVDDAEWLGIHVKLTGDQWYTHIHGGRTGLGDEWEHALVDEIFWKRADLTNEDIMIYQPYGRFFKPFGGIAYIKLIPQTEEQVEQDRKNSEKAILESGQKGVLGMNDFWNWVYATQMTSAEGTRLNVDNHKNAGMDTICFRINGGGFVHYHSKVAQQLIYNEEISYSPRIEAVADILKDHDPLKVASERAHEIGLQFFTYFRMSNEMIQQSDLIEYSRKYRHLRIRDADGEPARCQSLAYPEIRNYKLAILREVITEYKIDGLMLDYLRTLPCIGYDPPVIEAYVNEYGVDPLKMPSERSNPRWKKFRANYVTEFMRDVRKLVDEEEKKTGRHIEIATRVTPRDNLWKGLDVETWIKEGLVDAVAVSNFVWFEQKVSVKPFKQMAEGTKCKIYGGLSPFFAGGTDNAEVSPDRFKKDVADIIANRILGGPTNLEYAQKALEYYAEGADGVVFYETDALTAQPDMYRMEREGLFSFSEMLARDGLMPMFKVIGNPRELLSYAKDLEASEESK